jgi:zinc protease
VSPRFVTAVVLWACACSAIGAPAPAEAPPPLGAPRPFRIAERADISLENGLRATFVPTGQVPKATILVVVRTGGIDDGGKPGITELAAEFLKEGAGRASGPDLARLTADMGGALSIEIGADQSLFALDVLAEQAPEAIHVLADVLRRATLPPQALPRIRTNVMRQLAVMRSEPQTAAAEAFARLLWGNHPYGRGLPSEAQIAALGVEDVRSFLHRNLGAARSHVYVGGQFNPSAVERAVRADFGGWAAGPPPTVNAPVPTPGRSVVLIDRPGAPQSTVLLGLATVDPSEPDYLPLTLANTVLGGGLMSRLDEVLREQKGWTYGVRSHISAHYRSASWTLSADITTADTAAAIGEIYRQLRRFEQGDLEADELERNANYRAGLFVIGAASREGLLAQLAFLDLHGLPQEWLSEYPLRLHRLTPAEVTAVAARRLPPAGLNLVVVGDLAKIGAQLRALPELQGSEVRWRSAEDRLPSPGS